MAIDHESKKFGQMMSERAELIQDDIDAWDELHKDDPKCRWHPYLLAVADTGPCNWCLRAKEGGENR